MNFSSKCNNVRDRIDCESSGTPPTPQWKLSPEFVLEQLARHTRTDLHTFTRHLRQKLQLDGAQWMTDGEHPSGGTTPDGQRRTRKFALWRTPTAIINSTRYGRITEVRWERSNIKPQPTVVHKRRRRLELPGG